ncbi:AAA family ATPase [Acinetobacter indicus]|uniref:AAA family ATPase n=1 Tax=Acinetobacter indicus TaxID=756892 RepID=UPI00144495C9|nr:AAA family ATPase [Acinetobacter indicus]
MKINIKNFGPIQKFETTLNSDLTLIVGKNNIGKSYAISVVYLILKNFSTRRFRHSFYLHEVLFKNSDKVEKKYNDRIVDLQNKLNKNSSVDIGDFFSEYVSDFLKNIVGEEIKNSMNGTFGDLNLLERSESEKPFFSIKNNNIEFSFNIISGELANYQVKFEEKIILKKAKRNLQDKCNTDGSKTLYFNEKIYSEEGALKDYLAMRSLRIAIEFTNSISKVISDVHYLPASRSGLYQSLTAFGQIIAELAKRRTFVSSKIELPSISEPLTDYFLKITEIKSKKNNDNEYNKIAEKIEQDILQGKIDFDTKTKKIFYIKYNGNLRLDLSNTSSMVSEIGPIVAYLKHIIPASEKKDNSKSKQVIFIEEPEAHLHPEVQSKLMEIFVDLINLCNVKIILTSHSNFILNKLNNLILSNRLDYSKVAGYQFIATNEQGTIAQNLNIDEFGIDDTNFVDIASELYEEKLELFDKKMLEGN